MGRDFCSLYGPNLNRKLPNTKSFRKLGRILRASSLFQKHIWEGFRRTNFNPVFQFEMLRVLCRRPTSSIQRPKEEVLCALSPLFYDNLYLFPKVLG
ncbi:hypothetical protein TPPAVE_194 [Candidatus Tremblaya phenacola PAVE]|nr:hypothetical protein TPPAVE_194 [Candidatus Tremblaya phenacola PAVE]